MPLSINNVQIIHIVSKENNELSSLGRPSKKLAVAKIFGIFFHFSMSLVRVLIPFVHVGFIFSTSNETSYARSPRLGHFAS